MQFELPRAAASSFERESAARVDSATRAVWFALLCLYFMFHYVQLGVGRGIVVASLCAFKA